MKTARTPKRSGAPGLAYETWARAPRSFTVAGIMSGTSADGVDVAFARISPTRTSTPRIQLLGHRAFPYPKAVRQAVLAAMSSAPTSTAELSRLHWRLGQLYADAVQKTCRELTLQPDLIGFHGQTIYHQATAVPYLGKPTRTTWQLGEPAILRERLGIPVVSDFRPADLAAGGQGAPLVPMLDFCLFRAPKRNRILLNLGGIANLTVLPAACALEDLVAFDTGPANMVVDDLMYRLFGRHMDRSGGTAAKGIVLPKLLDELLRHPYFAASPPKSCGREQFGVEFTGHLQSLAPHANPYDLLATATELTAVTLRDACSRFCLPHFVPGRPAELIAAGGGTRNRCLMGRLTALLTPLGIEVRTADDLGLPSQAKEAVAFALLAWLTLHNLPGNVPRATGATHPAVLGKITL